VENGAVGFEQDFGTTIILHENFIIAS